MYILHGKIFWSRPGKLTFDQYPSVLVKEEFTHVESVKTESSLNKGCSLLLLQASLTRIDLSVWSHYSIIICQMSSDWPHMSSVEPWNCRRVDEGGGKEPNPFMSGHVSLFNMLGWCMRRGQIKGLDLRRKNPTQSCVSTQAAENVLSEYVHSAPDNTKQYAWASKFLKVNRVTI